MQGKPLIIGKGELGGPLYEIVRGVYPDAEWLDIEPREIQGEISVMHICFPYSDKFVEQVWRYIDKFKPALTIIESTVLPGTTMHIYAHTDQPICHSPVHGNVADGFKWSFFNYTKFIGPVTPESGALAEKYYKTLGFKTRVCNSPLETEFMKLINTTYYGLMIGLFQEIHRLCKRFGLDETNVVDFTRLASAESGGKHPRPVFFPGVIEGHCVIPNAVLLQEIFPSKFIDALLHSNELRKKEKATEERV